ncbi:MAG: hypothetical protein LM517_04475 [Nitrosomonas sp.]|nr:hypothetical protein [Nitrosomonas sp.]
MHGQARNSHIESVNAQFDPVHSLVERNDSFCLWIVTERADLIAWLQACSQRLPAIIYHRNFEQLKERYDGSKDFSHDLVLIDTALSDAIVIEQMREIRRNSPVSVKIILLYDRIFPALIKEIVEYSVSGLLRTGINQELFLKAIHVIHKGEYWFPPSINKSTTGFY